jgi:hypothetical protein
MEREKSRKKRRETKKDEEVNLAPTIIYLVAIAALHRSQAGFFSNFSS